jgi:hypothetical protein
MPMRSQHSSVLTHPIEPSAIDSLARSFCPRCGQPVMLHLTGVTEPEPDAVHYPQELQVLSCPWCNAPTEERLPGRVDHASKRYPPHG